MSNARTTKPRQGTCRLRRRERRSRAGETGSSDAVSLSASQRGDTALFGETCLERDHERGHRPVAVVRVLRHRALDERIDAKGHVRPARPCARHGVVDVLHRDRHGALAVVGRRAGEELVEEHSERVLVGPLVHVLADRLLGREVVARPENRPGLRQLVVDRGACDAEVGHLGDALVVHEHVLRLHVAVDDAALVRERQPARRLEREPERLRDRHVGPPSRKSFRLRPRTSSKTMYSAPSTWPRSTSVTMFGCERLAIARASRRKRSTWSGSPESARGAP